MAEKRCRSVTLEPNESYRIFGLKPKKSIHWALVTGTPACTLQVLLEAGLTLSKIQNIQPSLAEWFKAGKASIQHLAELGCWDLNIASDIPNFSPLQCIELSHHASPERMLKLGLSLRVMIEKCKLQVKEMAMMPYTMKQWIVLGFDMAEHGKNMTDDECLMVFKMYKIYAHHAFIFYKKEIEDESRLCAQPPALSS